MKIHYENYCAVFCLSSALFSDFTFSCRLGSLIFNIKMKQPLESEQVNLIILHESIREKILKNSKNS